MDKEYYFYLGYASSALVILVFFLIPNKIIGGGA